MASAQKTEIKIEHLCRTCLSKNNQLYSIFDVLIGTTITLDYIVSSTTGLRISKNDGLPATICCECREKAANAFEFKKKSEEANMSLRGILKREHKDWLSIKNVSQANATNVKTEDISSNDTDDYVDCDYSVPLTNGPDLHELEAVKNESDAQERKSCFVCKSCLDVYDTQEKLQDHEKICIKVECDETNRTFCPLCGTSYNGAENLTKHMWTSHADIMGPKKRGRPKKILTSTILNKLSENGFCITSMPAKKIECVFCNQHFETKEELYSHVLEHKDTKVLSCEHCKKIFLDIKKIHQHNCFEGRASRNAVNDSSKTENIEKKAQHFPLEITLREFLDSNINMENINLQICSACSCILTSEDDLVNHRDAEHPELSLRCNLCTKVFASLRFAARHRSICKQIERKYKCSTCGLKFAYEISLNKHILRYHEGQSVSVKFIDPKTKREDRQFQCDTCNRSFYKRELLVKHTKIHMPVENCFECDVCKKKFYRRDNLRSHKRVHDVHRDKSSSNNCLCLYCGRSFSNSSNLIVHMRRHTGEKPYKCDFCGKGFPRSSDLQCHRRSHTGEKPCICRVCGKGFSRSNKLSRHMRVHTGQRPYKCTYCEKAFSQSNDLNLHIRRHTGDRPYICEVCGDRFIQGTALQNHRRAHGHFPPPPVEAQPQSEVQALPFTVQSISHNNSH